MNTSVRNERISASALPPATPMPISMKRAEKNVLRLEKKIETAERERNFRKAKSLRRLLRISLSAKLLAANQATERSEHRQAQKSMQ